MGMEWSSGWVRRRIWRWVYAIMAVGGGGGVASGGVVDMLDVLGVWIEVVVVVAFGVDAVGESGVLRRKTMAMSTPPVSAAKRFRRVRRVGWRSGWRSSGVRRMMWRVRCW